MNNIQITADVSSIPVNFTTTGSFTITRQNFAPSMGYTALTSSNWSSIPTTVQNSLDILASNRLDNSFAILNSVDKTRILNTSILGTTGTTTTINTAPTANRNFRLPDLSGTAVVVQDSTEFVFMNQTGQLHSSNSGIQYATNASVVAAQSANLRLNQYGNNGNQPGITTFKSRNASIGGLTSVIDGDTLWNTTCIGVAPDNSSIPIAGIAKFYVPNGGSVPSNNYIASEFNIQLVPLAGPINGRRECFRISSEAILHIRESSNTMAGIAILDSSGNNTILNTQITTTTKINLTIQDGGSVPTGFVYVISRVIGTSFSISSSTGPGNSGVYVYYQLWEPCS